MKALAIAALFNVFNLAVAAAPTEPVTPVLNQEQLVGQTVLEARSAPEETYKRKLTVVLTAYSSTPDQTDSTPFITAANTPVRDGVAAANFLPFGTKFKVPKLFGDKVFTVEDRMHTKYNDRIDIWFGSRTAAKEFGLRKATVFIL